jgi:ribonucleotide reductase beta subunit family protein with ferritin-like domain
MEILLKNDESRLALFPIVYEDIWKMYKDSEAAFWTLEEVDFDGDKKDFESLSKGEKHFISHILAFFANADALVFDNIDSNFGEEIKIREAKCFYSFQRTMEGIHNEVYSAMIENLISDSETKHGIIHAVEKYPGIKKKADWALEYMDSSKPFSSRLLAFVIMEYLFFSGSFAAIFYFKKRGKMNGLCFSNELISRDEGLHAKFGCLLFTKYLNQKPDEDFVHDMIDKAVKIELEFVNESLPVSLLGMNCQEMSLYIRYIADHMSVALGYSKLYDVQNPFVWMEAISLQGKTNFFEKRVSEYSKAGVSAASAGEKTENFKFTLEEDF